MKRNLLFLVFCMVLLTMYAKQPTIIHSNKKNMNEQATMKAWMYNGQPKSAA